MCDIIISHLHALKNYQGGICEYIISTRRKLRGGEKRTGERSKELFPIIPDQLRIFATINVIPQAKNLLKT